MADQIREVGTDGITRQVATPASQPGDTFPAGSILMWPTTTPPSGWLLCNGTLVARATYPNLRDAFAADGYLWGAGDGSTTMALPNYEDHMPIGAGNLYSVGASGGEATHALTAAENAPHSHSVSATTGTESSDHSHSGTTGTENQSHNHEPSIASGFLTGNGTTAALGSGGTARYIASQVETTTFTESAAHNHNFTTGGRSAAHTHSFSTTSGSSGSGTAHNNLPPYKGIHFIIRAY